MEDKTLEDEDIDTRIITHEEGKHESDQVMLDQDGQGSVGEGSQIIGGEERRGGGG